MSHIQANDISADSRASVQQSNIGQASFRVGPTSKKTRNDAQTLDSAHRREGDDDDVQTYSYILPMSKAPDRYYKKPVNAREAEEEDGPLIDRTAALQLRSKRTERMQRRHQKKSKRTTVQSDVKSFLDLPSELLAEVLGHLRPSDLNALLLVNRATNEYILGNERSVVKEVIRRRYWILDRCFQLPVFADTLSPEQQHALKSKRWQDRLRLNTTNPYQHIKRIDPENICTCMSCVLAWNNMCTIIDLAHWQRNLNAREPIPMIDRGRYPDWNVSLLQANAKVVENAMTRPLVYARVLEMHLATITGTIVRHGKWRKKGAAPTPRLYHLTDAEIDRGTDEFLERSGPPSYEPLFHRDNYYSLGAFVPGRRWSREDAKWYYPPAHPKPHLVDVEYVGRWFKPDPQMEQRMDEYVERLRQQLAR